MMTLFAERSLEEINQIAAKVGVRLGGTIEIVELVKEAGNVLKLRAKCTGIDAEKLIWGRYMPTICFLLFVFQPDLIPSAACSGS